MHASGFSDLKISKLTLGTVQFGLEYGIANKLGKPSYETARDIIARAYDGGVNCLDTAATYGDSEKVLGRALHDLGIKHEVVIVSKVRPMPLGMSASEADAFVEESVNSSLTNLGLSALPVCLFHDERNLCYVESLVRVKDKGLVRHIGFSVMTPDTTTRIIETGIPEAVQIPTNILDKRFTGSGITQFMKERGIGLFVRSVYLQGLLLMPEEDIPDELAEVVPVRRRLERLAGEIGISLSELAMRYVLGIDGLTSAVVGVDSVEQMKENIALCNKGPLGGDTMERVDGIVPSLADNILMPTTWPNSPNRQGATAEKSGRIAQNAQVTAR